jgi:formylglycine-generating enzyme required for sulfatase activity
MPNKGRPEVKKTPIVPTIITGFIALLLGFGGYLGSMMYTKNVRKTVVASATSKLQEAPAKPRKGRGMVCIPGGKFVMGSIEGAGEPDEHPQHTVTVKGFYMDETEVTQAEYALVMGTNPSYFKGCPDCPVDSVSWDKADEYCKRVGKRLPTEAQWEYAARAGTTTNYYWGNEMNDAYAWHYGNSEDKTHPVAQKKPNAFGLYDMVGNVWEWCADWYAEDYYSATVSNNPTGPDSGQKRITRGGGFGHNRGGYILRCAYRNAYAPPYRNVNVGFRCVR